MVSAWIMHIKKVQKEKGITYKEAMKVASKSYKASPGIKKKSHKKHHESTCHKSKSHKKKDRKKKHKGGAHNTNLASTAALVPQTSIKEIGGTSVEGSSCTLPARDGSGSTSVADIATCSGNKTGGKRRTKKHRRKKRRKRRKSRKSRKRKKKRKRK